MIVRLIYVQLQFTLFALLAIGTDYASAEHFGPQLEWSCSGTRELAGVVTLRPLRKGRSSTYEGYELVNDVSNPATTVGIVSVRLQRSYGSKLNRICHISFAIRDNDGAFLQSLFEGGETCGVFVRDGTYVRSVALHERQDSLTVDDNPQHICSARIVGK